MNSLEYFQTRSIGRWTGGTSFNEYTEIDIILKDGQYVIARVNPMSTKTLDGFMTWDSYNKFHSSIPVWTMIGQVDLRGIFETVEGSLILNLEFENDGMAGAEQTHLVELSQDESKTSKYRAATTETPPPLPSGLFPPGTAADLDLTPAQLSSAGEQLLLPDLDNPGRRTDGFMLLKDGKLILESYQWGLDAKSTHLVASVTKSIVGIVIGIAIDQNLITLTDVISDSFPELKDKTTWGNEPAITVQHALSMTSGVKFDDLDTQRMLGSACVEEVILSAPRVQNPGERFRYDNGLPTLLTVLLERKTNLSFEAFTEKFLFRPLNITNYKWSHLKQDSIDGRHLVLTSGGLFMTVPDMAKLGQLMLNQGIYNGKRVVSEDWVRHSTQQHTPKGFYSFGYLWHLNTMLRHCGEFEDAYMALGAGENVIYVIPSQKIVFVAVCSSWSWASLTPPILETLRKTLLRELK